MQTLPNIYRQLPHEPSCNGDAMIYSMYHRLNIIYNFRGFLWALNTNVPLFANSLCKLSITITININKCAVWCKQTSFFHSYCQMSFDRCRFSVTLLFFQILGRQNTRGTGIRGAYLQFTTCFRWLGFDKIPYVSKSTISVVIFSYQRFDWVCDLYAISKSHA